MRLFYLLNLLTFVACGLPTLGFSSPRSVHRPAPVKNPIKSSPENLGTPIQTEHQGADSIPTSKNFEVKPSHHKLNQLNLTFDSGRFVESDVNKNILIMSYKRTILTLDEAELSVGFGLSPQNISQMQIGQKWNWRTWTTDQGEEYPLYFNFNILNYIDSSQMLAGLININHFKLQFAFGVEQLEFFHEKFSAEFGTAYGINGFSFSASMGWKF